MRILLIIMANVFVIISAILGANEYFALKRHSSFTVPFTDKMVQLGVIEADRRDRLLKEERISHCVGILLSMLMWLMLAKFIAGVSAVPVFILAVAAQIIFMKPELSESEENRNRYFNAHKNDMDALKYHEYLESLSNP